MEQLVIFGGSWSLGEFRSVGQELEVAHPGMTEYLSDQYRVSNFSQPGTSLWQTLNSVGHYLFRCQTLTDQRIIIFQNDPFFSMLSERFSVDYDQLYQDSIDIRQFYKNILEIFYIKLNDLAVKFNTKIYLCGTISSVDTDSIKNFDHLVNLCTCWIELLDPEYQPDVLPILLSKFFLLTCKKQKRLDMCEQIMDHTDQHFVYFSQLTENQYFDNPNAFGDFHPNRLAHQVMADHIKEFFKHDV